MEENPKDSSKGHRFDSCWEHSDFSFNPNIHLSLTKNIIFHLSGACRVNIRNTSQQFSLSGQFMFINFHYLSNSKYLHAVYNVSLKRTEIPSSPCWFSNSGRSYNKENLRDETHYRFAAGQTDTCCLLWIKKQINIRHIKMLDIFLHTCYNNIQTHFSGRWDKISFQERYIATPMVQSRGEKSFCPSKGLYHP